MRVVAADRRRALLVGIDEYVSAQVADVTGAAEDVEAVRRMLIGEFAVPEDSVTVLVDREATRDRILGELSSMLSSSGGALFYYSGAGSRTAKGGFTIVPGDGRTDGVFDIDLAELASLAASHPSNLLSIFDCSWADGAGPRAVRPDPRPRPAPRGLRPVQAFSYEGLPVVGTASLTPSSLVGSLGSPSFTRRLVQRAGEARAEPGERLVEEFEVLGRTWGDTAQPVFLPPVQPATLWAEVKRLLREPRLLEGVAVLEREIEQRKGVHPHGLLNVGIMRSLLGETDASTLALEQAVAQGSGALSVEARFHLGRVLTESGLALARAVDELRRVTTDNPRHAAAQLYLGLAIRGMIEADLNNEAREAFRRYLQAGAPLGQAETVSEYAYPPVR